jgi:hypothetical protein
MEQNISSIINSDDSFDKSWFVNKKDLPGMIQEHELWVKSDFKQGKQLDLSYVRLDDGQFANHNLSYAIFDRARLVNSNFNNSNLQGASFKYADVRYVNFKNTSLNSTIFKMALLDGAYFNDSFARSAIFASASLIKASFERFVGSGCKFNEAILDRSTFINSSVKQCDFTQASLVSTVFLNTDIGSSSFPMIMDATETIKADDYFINQMYTVLYNIISNSPEVSQNIKDYILSGNKYALLRDIPDRNINEENIECQNLNQNENSSEGNTKKN